MQKSYRHPALEGQRRLGAGVSRSFNVLALAHGGEHLPLVREDLRLVASLDERWACLALHIARIDVYCCLIVQSCDSEQHFSAVVIARELGFFEAGAR